MKTLHIAFILLLVFQTSKAQANGPDFKFRVAIEVSCKDQNLKAEIDRYLRNELNAFRDVDIVSKEQDRSIIVIAIKDRTTKDTELGFTMAVIFTKNYSLSEFKNKFSLLDKNDKSTQEYIFEKEREEFEDALILVGSQDNLESSCRSAVFAFNHDILEPERQFWQYILDRLDLLKKRQNKTSKASNA